MMYGHLYNHKSWWHLDISDSITIALNNQSLLSKRNMYPITLNIQSNFCHAAVVKDLYGSSNFGNFFI